MPVSTGIPRWGEKAPATKWLSAGPATFSGGHSPRSLSLEEHGEQAPALFQSLGRAGRYVDRSFQSPACLNGAADYIPFADVCASSGRTRREPTLLETVAPSDVVEGAVDDCWFVASASVLALRPDLVRSLFLPETDPSRGFFAVRIFGYGEWRVIWLDDRCPVSARGEPAFAHSASGSEMWPMLLEKALAKYVSATKVSFSSLLSSLFSLLSSLFSLLFSLFSLLYAACPLN